MESKFREKRKKKSGEIKESKRNAVKIRAPMLEKVESSMGFETCNRLKTHEMRFSSFVFGSGN